eukprot:524879-Pelagomonas_calceolata.AAC.2
MSHRGASCGATLHAAKGVHDAGQHAHFCNCSRFDDADIADVASACSFGVACKLIWALNCSSRKHRSRAGPHAKMLCVQRCRKEAVGTNLDGCCDMKVCHLYI